MLHYITTLLLGILCLICQPLQASPGIQLSATQERQAICSGQMASYTISLSNGFSQNYTLSTQGLPNGIDATFTPNQISPGNSTNLRIQAGGLAAGSYAFQVLAQAGGARIELALEIQVAVGNPRTPTTNSPASGVSNLQPNPTLVWSSNNTPASTTYELQLATSPNFNNILETAIIEDTRYILRQATNGYTSYFWRVRALSPCGNSAYSAIASFTTTNITCRRYTNNLPVNISEIGTSSVSSNIFVGASLQIKDIAVELRTAHTYIGDLSAQLHSPGGRTILIFDRPQQPERDFGCNQKTLYARWADQANQSASLFEQHCALAPATSLSADNIYRPLQAFTDLRNQDSQGNWRLELNDHVAGDGGPLESWSIEICYEIAAVPPQILVNEPLSVFRRGDATITTDHLSANHPGTSANNLVYTITDIPNEGQLWRNNQPLALNAAFTQADIDANRIRYVHADGIVLNDSFGFSLSAPESPSLTGNIFQIVIQVMDLSASLAQTAFINCAGENTAALQVTASGGLPPYQYALNGNSLYQDSNIFGGLAAGNYQVTVRDAQGQITNSPPLTINTPSPLQAIVTTTGRTLNIQTNGGTPPYSYRLDNGPTQSSPVFSDLPNGDYLVEVIDANNCVYSTTATIRINSIRISATIARPISCAGANDGIILAVATDGIEPFEYRLNNNPFQSDNTFYNLSPGIYTITARDQEGFQRASNTIILSSPSLLQASTSVTDYTIVVNAFGGSPPYTYNLSSTTEFQSENSFTVTNNGTYTITVQDAQGCLSTTTATVAVNTLDISTELITRPSCANSSDGSIQAIVTGGTPPLTYRINNGAFQTNNRFEGLAAGNYILSVRDVEGFTRTAAPYELIAPAPLLATANVSENNLSATVQGGTPPYRYQLVEQGIVQQSPQFENLPNGNYTLLVTDANNCSGSTSATISINTLSVTTRLLTPPSCANSDDGSIEAIATGGTPPLSYRIDNGPFQASNRFEGLAAGSYTLRVRDAEGFTRTAAPYELLAPAPLLATANVSENNLSAAAQGGTPPYRYQLIEPGIIQESPQFENLPNGDYTLLITDANGCTITQSATVFANTLVVNGELVNEISCPGTTDALLQIQVSGGRPPFSYQLNDGAFQDSPRFSGLGPGSYFITVRDADGFSQTNMLPFEIMDPMPLGMNTLVENNTITVEARGGTPPYLYSLDNVAYQTTDVFLDLPDAFHSVFVQDSNGCRIDTSVLVANVPLAFTVTLLDSLRCAEDSDARISLSVNSNFRPYTYQLNGGGLQADSLFTQLTGGEYTLTVRDGIGRTTSSNYRLIAPPVLTLDYDLETRTVIALPNGGTPPYRYRLDNTEWQDLQQFTEVPNGEYTLSVQDANGCEEDILISVIVNTDSPIAGSLELIAYPNPTSGYCQLLIPHSLEGVSSELFVYDLHGRVLQTYFYRQLPNSILVDLENVPSGVYILRLNANGKLGQVRVIVE